VFRSRLMTKVRMRASLLSQTGAYQSLPIVGMLDLPVLPAKREYGETESTSARAILNRPLISKSLRKVFAQNRNPSPGLDHV
jgi:hypothetical protein